MALAAFSAGTYRDVLVANWRYDWYLTNSISQIGYQVAVSGRLLLGLYVARTLDLGNLTLHRQLLVHVLLIGGVAGITGSAVFAGDFLAGGARPCRRGTSAASRGGRESGVDPCLCVGTRAAVSWRILTNRHRGARADRQDGAHVLSATDCFGNLLFYGFAAGPAEWLWRSLTYWRIQPFRVSR